jgi:hypothetical protein
LTINELAAVGLKYGPALMERKSNPHSVKGTMSASPDGVSCSVEIVPTFDFAFGKSPNTDT